MTVELFFSFARMGPKSERIEDFLRRSEELAVFAASLLLGLLLAGPLGAEFLRDRGQIVLKDTELIGLVG